MCFFFLFCIIIHLFIYLWLFLSLIWFGLVWLVAECGQISSGKTCKSSLWLCKWASCRPLAHSSRATNQLQWRWLVARQTETGVEISRRLNRTGWHNGQSVAVHRPTSAPLLLYPPSVNLFLLVFSRNSTRGRCPPPQYETSWQQLQNKAKRSHTPAYTRTHTHTHTQTTSTVLCLLYYWICSGIRSSTLQRDPVQTRVCQLHRCSTSHVFCWFVEPARSLWNCLLSLFTCDYWSFGFYCFVGLLVWIFLESRRRREEKECCTGTCSSGLPVAVTSPVTSQVHWGNGRLMNFFRFLLFVCTWCVCVCHVLFCYSVG